jgi:hypothetical protein
MSVAVDNPVFLGAIFVGVEVRGEPARGPPCAEAVKQLERSASFVSTAVRIHVFHRSMPGNFVQASNNLLFDFSRSSRILKAVRYSSRQLAIAEIVKSPVTLETLQANGPLAKSTVGVKSSS